MWVVYDAQSGEIVRADSRINDFELQAGLAEMEVADNQYQPNFYRHINELKLKEDLEGREVEPYQFLIKFTAAERIAIREAGETDPIIEDALFLLENAPLVDLDSELVINALNYFVGQGLITAERLAEIRGL